MRLGNGRGGERTNEMGGCCCFLLGGFATAGAARSIPIRDEIFFVLQCSNPRNLGLFFTDLLLFPIGCVRTSGYM
jgi:hypothetical protein